MKLGAHKNVAQMISMQQVSTIYSPSLANIRYSDIATFIQLFTSNLIPLLLYPAYFIISAFVLTFSLRDPRLVICFLGRCQIQIPQTEAYKLRPAPTMLVP